MDATDPYEFPFPECDPPLTEDRADIAHLRDLAFAVDAEVERIDALADTTVVGPDGAHIFSQTPTAYESGDFIDFTSLDFDNTGGGGFIDLADNALVCRPGERGFYYFTCCLRTTTANSQLQVGFNVNGTNVSIGSRGFSAGGDTFQSHEICVQLEEGDRVKVIVVHLFGSTTISINTAFFGGVKVLKL